jgi:hypothetical protein
MATLYISYFGGVRDGCPYQPISTEALTTSTTSGEAGAIPAGAKVARFFSSVEHYITEGLAADTNTAAVTNGFYYPASSFYDVEVNHIVGAARQFAAKSFS